MRGRIQFILRHQLFLDGVNNFYDNQLLMRVYDDIEDLFDEEENNIGDLRLVMCEIRYLIDRISNEKNPS